MGTSIENKGRDEGEGEEDMIIPWSCVDDLVRQELINLLNPDNIMSGNNWRGLAGLLGYTTAEIRVIESDKGVNTRVFFDSYDLKEDNSFNDVHSCLKEMNRRDCVKVVERHLPRIKQNFLREKEKEARLLQQCSSGASMQQQHSHHHCHPHPSHSFGGGAACGGCSCSSHYNPPSVPPPSHQHQHSCYSMCSSSPSHPSHDCYNKHSGHPASPCFHSIPPPLPGQHQQMASLGLRGGGGSGGGGGCSNQSPSRNCSHMCSQQQQQQQQQPMSCVPPHYQMDISPSVPKYFHASPSPSHPNIGSLAFSDRPPPPQANSSSSGASPNHPYLYYGGVRNNYSPGLSPESNSSIGGVKPFNFSLSDHAASKGALAHPLPDNISPQFNSVGSNDNNMSYPTGPSPSSVQYHPHQPHPHHPSNINNNNNGHSHNNNHSNHSNHHITNQSGSQVGVGARAAAGLPMESPVVIDSKESLQKLAEISKMPNQYQPACDYQTVVADPKSEKKKQRGRTTRGSGTGSIISSSSSNSSASSASSSSSHSGPPGAKPVGQQLSSHPEDLPPMAGLSIGQSLPGKGGTARRGPRSKVFVTYSKDSKLGVLQLSIFLKENQMLVYADVASEPSRTDEPVMPRNVEPYEEYYTLADFILVCISPMYLCEIAGTSPPSPPTSSNGSSRPIHTREIYRMMRDEHQRRNSSSGAGRNKGANCRFVSLLFGDLTKNQLPEWMRRDYPVFEWPSDFKNLGWFLKRPQERIFAQPNDSI